MDTGWTTFIAPFSLDMWFGVLILVLICACAMTTTFTIGRAFSRRVEDYQFSLKNTIFIAINSFSQQGIDRSLTVH